MDLRLNTVVFIYLMSIYEEKWGSERNVPMAIGIGDRVLSCGPGENRTPIGGFGDRSPTIKRQAQ